MNKMFKYNQTRVFINNRKKGEIMNEKLPGSQDHEKIRNKNPEYIDQNSKNKQIRKPKEYKIVLEFFVKTLYVNVGLN